MRIKLTSVFVSDQEKALHFYTEVLGFAKKTDIPMGKDRWLTVVSPEGLSEVELLLEPIGFDPARTYQKALFDTGIPLTSFGVDDIEKEHARLEKLGAFQNEAYQDGSRHRRCTRRHVRQSDSNCAGVKPTTKRIAFRRAATPGSTYTTQKCLGTIG